ncbi:hypothetical protein HYPSUDRAFT_47458 [Hypholoma sublateritium FD-334 SS-4]|uniref:Uncharacterized protein n=1 Tax=Hypholoma sublateritium (strain FD-334 SS-4) TaxID=945553 RepID=A0A0D2KP14_HYPSF|nr:hypothetical protein HYPSUDRAFT_47458 [Hypholoma sublateritium FD-334 SS-4]
MDSSGSNNADSRGQKPPKPSGTRPGTQGPMASSASYFAYYIPIDPPTSALASPFPPGPYDRRGYYIPPITAIHMTNATQYTKHGPYTAQGSDQHQPPVPSTHVTALHSKLSEVTQSDNLNHPISGRRSDLGPLAVRPNSDFVVVYLSIVGPPLVFKKQDGREHEPGQISRARLSAAWHRPDVRAALWSHPETRRQLLDSVFAPPEPMSFEEANKVLLNDIRLPLRLELTQEEFRKGLSLLYPSQAGSVYHISEWAIACPKCGEEVVGYATDALWNERYLNHRKNMCGRTSDAIYP